MNFAAFNARLSDRRNAMLVDAVATLESGIAAGAVRNVDFTDAKDTINRTVDDAYNHYQDETLDFDGTLIMGAYNLPAGIKQATKDKAAARLAVLSALLPLHDLIQAAKPLVAKRQTGAGAPKTAAQIEREAATMTCQCCGKRYLANTGSIAHHGYQRPGGGWQTASCMGAKASPFEVGRDRLGRLIESLKAWEVRAMADRKEIQDETQPVTLRFPDRSAKVNRWGQRPTVLAEVTRDTFEAARRKHSSDFLSYGLFSFDTVKAAELSGRDREIKGVRAELKAQEERFYCWNPTAQWNVATKEWEPTPE